jgi:pyruvate dehydrogenase phosphatase regulatory subunit
MNLYCAFADMKVILCFLSYLEPCNCLFDDRYFMVGPTAQQTRSFAWLKDHLPKDGSVQLSDVTSMYTALDLIGPKAQELLSELTDTPLGKQDFMHMSCKV